MGINDYSEYEKANTLTVSELIELLETYPPDARVETEGCDCIGPADRVDELEKIGDKIVRIYIGRLYGY